MPRPKKRRPRRKPRPLRVSLADRLGGQTLAISPRQPKRHAQVLLPDPPRSARDVLGLLMAATGMALAARRDAKVTVLPGMPITVVLTAGDQPAAAFILPNDEYEARQLFGEPAPEPRDHLLEQLFEEDRQAELATPDLLLDQHRAWGLDHAC